MGGDQVGRLGGVMHGFHHYVRNATHRTTIPPARRGPPSRHGPPSLPDMWKNTTLF